jgi:hypothetical protein
LLCHSLLPPLRRGKVIHGMALAEERRGMNAYCQKPLTRKRHKSFDSPQ